MCKLLPTFVTRLKTNILVTCTVIVGLETKCVINLISIKKIAGYIDKTARFVSRLKTLARKTEDTDVGLPSS